MADNWEVILESDDDCIDRDMADWAEIAEFWYEDDFGCGYSFVQDVLAYCDHVDIEEEEWDGGGPGQSGVNYTVSTDDAELLRKEIKERAYDLKFPPPPKKPLDLYDMSNVMSVAEAGERLKRLAKDKEKAGFSMLSAWHAQRAARYYNEVAARLLSEEIPLLSAVTVLRDYPKYESSEDVRRVIATLANRLEALANS